MDDKRKRLIFLHHIPGMTRKVLGRLLRTDPTLKNIFLFTPSELSAYAKIPLDKSTLIQRAYSNVYIKKAFETTMNSVFCITIFDKEYPTTLKNIPDFPYVLYGLGNKKLLQTMPSISVIGTRQPSDEAMKKLDYLISPLIQRKWVIVSGLAYGIDSFAHQLALQLKGYTIAVLGGGFQHLYPRQNKKLFQTIMKEGLVISEYPPHIPPRKYHFPERNRIISGLSQGTLVIEAMEKSGTMITVDQALEQGKEVFAVPGSILHLQSQGCHRLIQDGAKLVMCVEDIVEDWPTVY